MSYLDSRTQAFLVCRLYWLCPLSVHTLSVKYNNKKGLIETPSSMKDTTHGMPEETLHSSSLSRALGRFHQRSFIEWFSSRLYCNSNLSNYETRIIVLLLMNSAPLLVKEGPATSPKKIIFVHSEK